MLRSIFILLTFCILSSLSAQHLDKEFHKQRREDLRRFLPPNSVAIFFSATEKIRSNDINYPFHQNPDFYYLTGYKEPNAILVIYSDSVLMETIKTNEVIFVRPKDAYQELWNGNRLGVNGVKELLGFQTVYSIEQLPKIDLKINNRLKFDLLSKDERSSIKKQYPQLFEDKKKVQYYSLSDFMNQLRETKFPIEIEMLKRAIDISCIGQIETMKALTPEMTEMEAQGIHEFVFKKYNCGEVGYPSIVGAGNNSCVLHYTKSEKDLKDGELILMDVGAEYEGYSADVTRTIPVNGKFSEEQKIIYEIVKKAQEAGFEECKVGNDFYSTHRATQKIIAKELLKLGIIKNSSEVKSYFPHGTTHYLGLDVHDRGTFGVFKANTIITVEPGIYIPEGSNCDKKWWGIGIRIEDDILITENKWFNLSENAPRSIEDVEKIMEQTSPLNNFKIKSDE